MKCYKRKKSDQYLITLTRGHEFKADENVYIVAKDDFEKLQEDNKNTQKYYQELSTLKNDYRLKSYDNYKNRKRESQSY